MRDSEDNGGLEAAAAALDGAEIVAFPSGGGQESGAESARPRGQRGGGRKGGGGGGGDRPRTRAPRRDGLPPLCPVTPLGTHDGTFFYLDAVGQLRALKARDHGNKDLLALFSPKTYFLHEQWPRMNAAGVVTGWRPEEAGEELMCACAIAGVWNAMEKVRGRGAWLDDAGGLILHVGDGVWMDGQWQATGLHDGHVYPAAPALPRPRDGHASPEKMDELLDVLKSWQWGRPAVDPYLMMGWLAAAHLGGALEWRPLAWVTGDKGTGKSTLHRLIKGILGGGLLSTSDATEAGIRQTLGTQTLPVAIDEAEADEDNRKLQALIKLARQAASGGNITRGGADHQAQAFIARSCFLLSSILIPPLHGQDRSRLAILELKPLLPGAPDPELTVEWMRSVGAAMQRRLVDGWPRFETTLQAYRRMLKQAGHAARGADQFGTLLACTDLLLNDTAPSEDDLAGWEQMVSAAALAETGEDVSDADRCLSHLLTSSVALDGGGRPQAVAHWVGRALRDIEDGIGPNDRNAEKQLYVYGLRVVERRADNSRWLAVANAHQGLARLFAGSHWQARSGAAGVWGQSLQRLAGALAGQNVRINGRGTKCVLVPMALVRDEGEEVEF
ncbi:MAG: hypothetical protein WDA25_01045 [Paracoccaceae bacterium]